MTIHSTVTYAFDAYCGWCYGFGPAVRAFAEANADRIQLEVVSGPLFTGSQARAIGTFPHIPEATKRIEELTGVTFGAGYMRMLADGSTVMNSVDASAGVLALRSQDHVRPLDAAAAVQHAWAVDGRDLSDPRVYREIAETFGLDVDAVVAVFADPATRNRVEAGFRRVRQLGVDSYPTLLLHTKHGVRRLGGPTSTAQALTRALDEGLAA
jgi:putative protein-disulfide isomerase